MKTVPARGVPAAAGRTPDWRPSITNHQIPGYPFGRMDDEIPEPVATFLDQAEAVFYEYDEGYVDPDAALSRLGDHVGDLRDAYEDEE